MKKLLFTVGFSVIAVGAQATNWNESISGELSGNPLAPTPLTLETGVNFISGSMGRNLPSDPIDRDIFTFTLAPGQTLRSINVLAFEPTSQSFYAIAPGNTIDINDPAGHLSNMLVKGVGEILDDLDEGSYSGGTGLTAPLGSGTYTIWFQELSSIVSYQMAYTVEATPVPEPGTALWGAAISLYAVLLRKRG